MKRSKKHTLWFTVINAFLFISTVIVTYITLSFGTVASQVDTSVDESWFYILTFTVQSNILLGLIALAGFVFGLRNLKKGKSVPKSYATWYLVASSAAMLTAITVIFFLAPGRAMQNKNYFEMLMGPMFFFHFFNPFLSAISFIFFTGEEKLGVKNCLFALIPPACYAIPYILNVVILKNWYDFYGFTFGGHAWATFPVFIIISLVTFSIATLLASFHDRYIKKIVSITD